MTRQLLEQPWNFNFFQAVRLLQAAAGDNGAAIDSATALMPVGYDGPPDREAVRFRSASSLMFPGASVGEIRPRIAHRAGEPNGATEANSASESNDAGALPEENPTVFELTTPAIGLTGAIGAMPHHYTSLLMQRIRQKDYALRDFLDLFNHRLISFFYRAWEKYRLPPLYERGAVNGDDADAISQVMYGIVGLATGGIRRGMRAPRAWVYYSGFFAAQPRSAQALESMLADYFETSVRVEQFYGQWLQLEPSDRSRLPTRGRQGLNHRLGESLVVGERVWDVQSKFLVRVGPLGKRRFFDLLPGGEEWIALVELIQSFAGPGFDFAMQLVLRAAETPPCELLGARRPDAPRLGRSAWISSRPFQRDADDPIFHSSSFLQN